MSTTTVDLRKIFGDLADARRWVAWDDQDGRKTPIDPTSGRSARSNDPSTWGTLEDAQCMRDERGLSGVGFVLGDGYGGIDLDACRDPETGEITEWAREFVDGFASYTEVSPSGTGVKIIASGAPDELPCSEVSMDGPRIRGKGPAVECFVRGRYFTVTGQLVDGSPDEIRDCGDLGDAWDRMVAWLRKTGGDRSSGPAPEVEETISSGARNNTLTSLAGTMRRRGMDAPEILAALQAVNDRRCSPPLPDAEVKKIAWSVSRYAPAPPQETREPVPGSSGLESEQDAKDWVEQPNVPGPPEPDPLPSDALPPALRHWAEAVARSVQVHPDMTVLLSLASTSAAVGGRVVVRVDGAWDREVVTLYGVVVAPPGERKSPAFRHMTEPLRSWERERQQRVETRRREAESVVEVAEERLSRLKKKAARGESDLDAIRVATRKLEQARREVPAVPDLLAHDSTPEALVQQMGEQVGQVAVLSPEGGPFRILDGRYSSGAARLEELAQAYDGEELVVRRIGRDTIRVRNPVLTVCVALQPSVLDTIRNGRSLRGQGIYGRISWVLPPSLMGERVDSSEAPPIDQGAGRRYERTLRRLLEWDPADEEDDGTPVPHVLELSDEAARVKSAYHYEVEGALAPDGELRGMSDWAGKAVGRAIRLAALIELAAQSDDGRALASDPISGSAMKSAVRICRALTTHARAAYGEMEMNPDTADLRYVLKRAREIPRESSLRDLHRAVQGRASIDGMEDLKPLVDELVGRGCLRLRPRPSTGGRPPSPLVEIHPHLRTEHDKSDENPRRVGGETTFGGFVTADAGRERQTSRSERVAPEYGAHKIRSLSTWSEERDRGVRVVTHMNGDGEAAVEELLRAGREK